MLRMWVLNIDCRLLRLAKSSVLSISLSLALSLSLSLTLICPHSLFFPQLLPLLSSISRQQAVAVVVQADRVVVALGYWGCQAPLKFKSNHKYHTKQKTKNKKIIIKKPAKQVDKCFQLEHSNSWQEKRQQRHASRYIYYM